MANQSWIDQTNLTVTASADPQARIDQANMTVVASADSQARIEQLNLTVVWDEAVLIELIKSSAANMFEQISDTVTDYADHESSAQKVKRCEDHFSEDYDAGSLAEAFYEMEN